MTLHQLHVPSLYNQLVTNSHSHTNQTHDPTYRDSNHDSNRDSSHSYDQNRDPSNYNSNHPQNDAIRTISATYNTYDAQNNLDPNVILSVPRNHQDAQNRNLTSQNQNHVSTSQQHQNHHDNRRTATNQNHVSIHPDNVQVVMTRASLHRPYESDDSTASHVSSNVENLEDWPSV